MSAKFRSRTPWREKMDRPAKVVALNGAQARRWGRRLLIASPLDVDALIRRTPARRLITVGAIRETLARRAGADAT